MLFFIADRVILFLSDGEPTNATKKDILNVIEMEQAKLQNDVLILTYELGNGTTESYNNK